MTIPYEKPALTFDQQLQKLADRGIEIPDRSLARQQLSLISYYRLSAYWYPFRVRDEQGRVTNRVRNGVRWDDIIELYEFDRRLRLLVMDAIERVEVAVRTQLTYHFAHTYGPFGHVLPDSFRDWFGARAHSRWIDKLREEAANATEAFITHYQEKYDGFPDLPVWMLTELMSLGSLSFWYTGLENRDKRAVSAHFNLHYKRLEKWLHSLTVIRNICAHHSRLWNRQLAVKPDQQPEPEWQPPLTPRNDRIFYVLLMLRQIMRCDGNGDDWAASMDALLEPICANDEWREAMGVPENWKRHPLWLTA